MHYCEYGIVETMRGTCKHFHDVTKDLRKLWHFTGMRRSHYTRMIYAFVRWSKTDEGFPGLSLQEPLIDSQQRPVCARWMEFHCDDPYCSKSHKEPVFQFDNREDTHQLMNTDTLDFADFLLTVSFVFSPEYLWSKEVYIKELFDFYAVQRKRSIRKVCTSIHFFFT